MTSSLKSTRPVTPRKPPVPVPATIGCWKLPWTSEPVKKSGSKHAVLDWMLFLGHTYFEHISGVSEEQWVQ